MWPWQNLEADFPDLDVDLSVADPVGDFSYYATLSVPSINNVTYIGNWKRRGGQWVWCLDDDYTCLPDFNPLKLTDKELDIHRLSADVADVIWVSTRRLADSLGRPEKTVVSPNLLPVAAYDVQDPAPVGDGQPLRVLWAGSKTHAGDLELVEDAVDETLKKWTAKRVEFIFVGSCPSRPLKRWLNNGVHFEKGVGLGVYPRLLKTIRPHVVLAPLVDHPFNHSKSNIRVLEGWSLAAAVVASPVGEYRVVEDGVDGLHAATAADWFPAIDRLLADRDYREHLAAAGRRRVRDFDWANPAAREPWRQAVRHLQSRLT